MIIHGLFADGNTAAEILESFSQPEIHVYLDEPADVVQMVFRSRSGAFQFLGDFRLEQAETDEINSCIQARMLVPRPMAA